MGDRGPKPDRELRQARAVLATFDLPRKRRPTIAAIAKEHGVTTRQIQSAYKKHRAALGQERDAKLAQAVTARLEAQDAMTPADRRRHREQLEARVKRERARVLQRKRRVKKRGKKKKEPRRPQISEVERIQKLLRMVR